MINSNLASTSHSAGQRQMLRDIYRRQEQEEDDSKPLEEDEEGGGFLRDHITTDLRTKAASSKAAKVVLHQREMCKMRGLKVQA